MDPRGERIPMARYVVVGTLIQLARVVAAHYSGVVSASSALLGIGIACAVGGWFGATAVRRVGHAAAGGLVAASGSAFLAIALAVLLHEYRWPALIFGPVIDGLAGMAGGTVLFLVTGGRPPAPPVQPEARDR